MQTVTLDDVRAAFARLKGPIAPTPCPYSETLSALTGSRVFVKLENLQMTGSFKERGAAKVTAARRHGAEVILHGDNYDASYERAREIETERGLVKDSRIVRLIVLLRDRPGSLARLTRLVAEARPNVLHIGHDRAFSRARLGETEVELTLETSGHDHIDAVKRHLHEAGHTVEEVLHR